MPKKRLFILNALAKLGLGMPALSAYAALTQSWDLRTVCHVSEKIQGYYPPENSRGTILIFITYNNPVMEFVLAAALAARKYDPLLLTNLGSLPLETTLKYSDKAHAQYAIKRHNLSKFECEFNIPVESIESMLDPQYEHPSVKHLSVGDSLWCEGIEISPYAKASTRKYFQRYRLNSSSYHQNRVYRDFLRGGAMIAHACKNVLDQNDVTAGIFQEGAYVHGGIPAEIFAKQGIPKYHVSGGRIHNHLTVGMGRGNLHFPEFDSDEIINAVRRHEITDADRALLESRLPQTSGESVRKTKYMISEGKEIPQSNQFTVGVFSHLLWDGSLEPTDALFPDFYDWLQCTIDTLAEYPEMRVYLKAHPAEEIKGTNEYLSDWLEEFYPNLPSHIQFIPPDSGISFYDMLPSLDAGVVYASTVGAEMAYEKIPVVIGGYPPYIGYNIGFEPSNVDDFEQLLRRLPELEVTTRMHARCERFLYHIFVNKPIPFPVDNKSTGHKPSISYDLLMSEQINMIIEKIICGEMVQRSNVSE